MSGEAFTKPTQDGDWLEAWIDGARLPEEVATVYGRRDLRAEYLALEQELTTARDARIKGESSGDERLTSKTAERRIAERMETIREQMLASRRTFRFRALLDTEVEQVQKDAPKDTSAKEMTYRLLAVQSVEPKLTWEQLKRINAAIGEGQFNELIQAAGTATAAGKVDIPFSLAASTALSTKE